MALAALIPAMDGHHWAVVYAAAPQIGQSRQQAGRTVAFGRVGNSKLRHLYFEDQSYFDSTPEFEFQPGK